MWLFSQDDVNYILQYTFPFACAAKMQFKKASVDVVEVVVLEAFEEHVPLRILQEEEVLGKNVCCKILPFTGLCCIQQGLIS